VNPEEWIRFMDLSRLEC